MWPAQPWRGFAVRCGGVVGTMKTRSNKRG